MNGISVKNLSFSYPGDTRLILKDIDLEVESGEFVCLLGQSGCGKSTLLRLLAGLEKPTVGEIRQDGEIIEGAGLDRGVVFQSYGLFPWMTAGSNIMLASDGAGALQTSPSPHYPPYVIFFLSCAESS